MALACARLAVGVVVLWLAALAWRGYSRKHYLFLSNYISWALTSSDRPSGTTHVFVVFVDHFEPDYDVARTVRWLGRYSTLAARHRDADGRPPRHTWFYPGDQISLPILAALSGATRDGLGEVELHFHHNYTTAGMLRPRLQDAIAAFQSFGFLVAPDGRTHFAFVHGNSGLDDANGPIMCGVRRELALLRELGCFADFSFPSVALDSQPPVVNSIYAARDDDAAKSYARALDLTTLDRGDADLMIFEGPLVFAPTFDPRRLFLELDDGDIHPGRAASATRVERWVRAAVHVPARPDWLFIKLAAHGVSSPADEEVVVGSTFDTALSFLEARYNDGRGYALHYVTAREAYNLARAAADGAAGQPEQYFDAVIPRYVATAARLQ